VMEDAIGKVLGHCAAVVRDRNSVLLGREGEPLEIREPAGLGFVLPEDRTLSICAVPMPLPRARALRVCITRAGYA